MNPYKESDMKDDDTTQNRDGDEDHAAELLQALIRGVFHNMMLLHRDSLRRGSDISANPSSSQPPALLPLPSRFDSATERMAYNNDLLRRAIAIVNEEGPKWKQTMRNQKTLQSK